jgi:hypothetical protein
MRPPGRFLSVAALIPLAPTFQAAGRLAEHVSERAVGCTDPLPLLRRLAARRGAPE